MSILFLALFFCTSSALAQPTASLRYSNLRSPGIDKIFQLYNFSRPWHGEALSPLMNGYGIDAGWYWKINKGRQIHLLPAIGYERFSTTATNNDTKYSAGMNVFDISAGLRFHPKSIFKRLQTAGALGTRWFIHTTPGYTFYTPFVKSGKELLKEKEEIYRPIASSFTFTLGTGFHLTTIGRFILTPEISATWIPQVKLQDFPSAVNAHNITTLDDKFSNVLFLNASLRITFAKMKHDWWEKPRQGDKT